MSHEHTQSGTSGRRFLVATVMNATISLAELIGGIMSGSLALVSDAVHNFTDTLSLILAWVAQVIAGKKQDARNTYGYRRAQILAAFVNAIFLMLVTLGLIYEAIDGFLHPHPIAGQLMLIVAVIGLIANLITTLLLAKGREASLNQRAAFLHVLADTLSSIGVILAAVLIVVFHWNWIDPILTLIVAAYMLKAAWPVLQETTEILMQANVSMDVDAIYADLKQFPVAISCHHFHAWEIDENNRVISFHVTMADRMLSEVEAVTSQMRKMLIEKYDISHVTIQVEVDKGLDKSIIMDDSNDHP